MLTVLLVEDNSTDLFVIKEVLAQCRVNARLQIARDGQAALSYLQAVANDSRLPCPGLALLDLNLPGIAGIEVLKAIRNGPRCERIPVIVVTSSDSNADREVARQLGADAYFRKPTSLDAYFDLPDVIRRVLGSSDGRET